MGSSGAGIVRSRLREWDLLAAGSAAAAGFGAVAGLAASHLAAVGRAEGRGGRGGGGRRRGRHGDGQPDGGNYCLNH